MAKIKHTKNELKSQREAMRRYERFLPMLQLKKQQLQLELRQIEARLEEQRATERRVWEGIAPWIGLFATIPAASRLVAVKEVVLDQTNIAGINIPVFRDIRFYRDELDLFVTPSWYDQAQETLMSLARLRAEVAVLDEQRRLIAEELRTTSQRVNLFEKVKIPECRENIRFIRIFLGDEQTAGVARAKFAKGRTEVEEATVALSA